MLHRLGAFINKQGEYALNNTRQSVLLALLLMSISYTSWLSLALMALVTLRKGCRSGSAVLIPLMVLHYALSISLISSSAACLNTILTILPCYAGACLLRVFVSWQMVAGFYGSCVLIFSILAHKLMPKMITAQYAYMKDMINSLQLEGQLSTLLQNTDSLTQTMMANYFFGGQELAIIVCALFPLLFARAFQSKLYYPGEFYREILSFRGEKIALILLLGVFLAANFGFSIAMNLLPCMLFYFFISGISFCLNVLSGKNSIHIFCILVMPLIFLPFIMLPVYFIFGILDSLFYFRKYLPLKADKL